jgi:lipid II:glycine glycyltransferase (peptidoglycan interpeptide bridge formation enzyme)
MGTNLQIRVARKSGTPIAAILSLRHRASVTYKYGGSDERFHNVGAMPFLLWRLIEESKETGAETIDLGRSDLDNAGLIRFKDQFGASRRSLDYYRYPESVIGEARWGTNTMRHLVSKLPNTVVCAAGRVLYRHMG